MILDSDARIVVSFGGVVAQVVAPEAAQWPVSVG